MPNPKPATESRDWMNEAREWAFLTNPNIPQPFIISPTGVEGFDPNPERDWPLEAIRGVETSASVGEPLSCDKCETPICEHTASVVATLQAERDRLRDEMKKLSDAEGRLNRSYAEDKQNLKDRAEAAESQLAEARKAHRAALNAISGLLDFYESSDHAENPCGNCVICIAYKSFDDEAALSQPTNPPAVPSEEEIDRALLPYLTVVARKKAARAVLALLKGETKHD